MIFSLIVKVEAYLELYLSTLVDLIFKFTDITKIIYENMKLKLENFIYLIN